MPGPRPDPLEALARGIHVLAGRSAAPEELRRFGLYLDLLLRWNRVHHLTALRSREDITRKLFLDSLLLLALLPPRPLALADLGAGPGIPGIPLRIIDAGIALTLIEARRKPVSFLLALARELGLGDIQIREGRAERLISEDTELLEKFDVVVSRGLGHLAALLPVAMRFLKPGGLFLVPGPPPGQSRPRLPPGVESRVISFPALGLSRAFLLAHKVS